MTDAIKDCADAAYGFSYMARSPQNLIDATLKALKDSSGSERHIEVMQMRIRETEQRLKIAPELSENGQRGAEFFQDLFRSSRPDSFSAYLFSSLRRVLHFASTQGIIGHHEVESTVLRARDRALEIVAGRWDGCPIDPHGERSGSRLFELPPGDAKLG